MTNKHPFRKYEAVLDGSRLATLRNRRFLKRISPISKRPFDSTPELHPSTDEVTAPPPVMEQFEDPPHVTMRRATQDQTSLVRRPNTDSIVPSAPPASHLITDSVVPTVPSADTNRVVTGTPPVRRSGTDSAVPNVSPVDTNQVVPSVPLVRRSARVRVERKPFQAKLSGKAHE